MEVQDHQVDHDWTARFFSDVQDVSSEQFQDLWAKVLAGEVERPRSTSIKTLGILRNLDKENADLFRRPCSVCVSTTPDGIKSWDARVPTLGNELQGNSLRAYGIDYDSLNVVNEHGLIISNFNSWYDIKASIRSASVRGRVRSVHIPFCFQGSYWILISTTQA